MKKIILVIVLLIMFLTSCSPVEEQVVVDNEIVSLSEQYEFVTPYKKQKSYTYYSISPRLDKYEIDNINLSLMEISKEYFDTKEYYFMEDQYFSVESQKNLIDVVNPKVEERVNNYNIIPEYLIGVQVQNYTMQPNGEDLKGIAVGLVLNKNQVYTNSSNRTIRTTIDETELINSMKMRIPTIIESLRSVPEFSEVEIVVGFYIIDSANSLVPGSYSQYGYVASNSNRIAALSNYVAYQALLPSAKAAKFDEDFNQKFIEFVDSTKSQYQHNVGIIGRMHYNDSRVKKLSITIKSSNNKKTFLLSLTQTVYNEILNRFDDGYDVEVVISSYDKVEATIVRESGSDFVVTTYE